MSFFLSALFFSQVAFSQIVFSSFNGTNDVYEASNVSSYVDVNIDVMIEKTAALRYYLIKEIIANDNDIFTISRSGGNGIPVVFEIVTVTGLTATIVEDKINASMINSNTFLKNLMTTNNWTSTQLSNHIKSVLLQMP